jgi:hypothetical protein
LEVTNALLEAVSRQSVDNATLGTVWVMAENIVALLHQTAVAD